MTISSIDNQTLPNWLTPSRSPANAAKTATDGSAAADSAQPDRTGQYAAANPRAGGAYTLLTIWGSAETGGVFIPGGPSDDVLLGLCFGTVSDARWTGKEHPYQAEYDEYNEIFNRLATEVLTERDLMPASGKLTQLEIRTGDIYDVVYEIMNKVQADPRAAELIESLGLVYPEYRTGAQLAAEFQALADWPELEAPEALSAQQKSEDGADRSLVDQYV